jgi:hypothetical protein
MEKVFIITDRYRLEDGHAHELNHFLKENWDYEIKSVTPISQNRKDSQPGYYGVVVVVGKKTN